MRFAGEDLGCVLRSVLGCNFHYSEFWLIDERSFRDTSRNSVPNDTS